MAIDVKQEKNTSEVNLSERDLQAKDIHVEQTDSVRGKRVWEYSDSGSPLSFTYSPRILLLLL